MHLQERQFNSKPEEFQSIYSFPNIKLNQCDFKRPNVTVSQL